MHISNDNQSELIDFAVKIVHIVNNNISYG